jgi:hypothetical protein
VSVVHVIESVPRSGAPSLDFVTRSGHAVRLQPDFELVALRKVIAALERQPR